MGVGVSRIDRNRFTVVQDFVEGLTICGTIHGGVQNISSSGVVSDVSSLVVIDSSSGVLALTFGHRRAVIGQRIQLVCLVGGNNAVVTCTGVAGVATITFTAAGQAAELMCVSNNGDFALIASRGVTVA